MSNHNESKSINGQNNFVQLKGLNKPALEKEHRSTNRYDSTYNTGDSLARSSLDFEDTDE